MATRAEVNNGAKNYSALLDADLEHVDGAQRLPEPEPPLPHWSAHRRDCRLPGMYKYVPSQLHNQVMDLVEEYDASRPRIQFISQVEDFIESHAELKNTALPCDIVLARWAEQGLASYADADQWGHEEPEDTIRIPAQSMLSDFDADMSFLGNHGAPPTRPSEPNTSRPLHQFLAQVAMESRALADQMRRDHLLRYYDSSGTESFDATPLEITRPDIGTLAYQRVRRSWIKWQIWDRRWGLLPGLAWKHEQYLDDFVRERLGEELFSRLPPNYLQGMGSLRVPAYEYDDPGKRSPSEARHRILQPPIIFRASFLDGLGDGSRREISMPVVAAPISPACLTDEPTAAAKVEEFNEPACEYEVSDGGSDIENEDPGADMEPTEMGKLVAEQNGSEGTSANLVTKGEEADFEMEEAGVEESGVESTGIGLYSTLMHTTSNEGPSNRPPSRPMSSQNVSLHDDCSNCPSTNPDGNSDSKASSCLGTDPARMTRGPPPGRRGNPYKVMKPGSSSARSISHTTAERAALLAIPQPGAAAAAATAATEAWMDQHSTYPSPIAAGQEEASGSPASSATGHFRPEEQARDSGSDSTHRDDGLEEKEKRNSAEEQ